MSLNITSGVYVYLAIDFRLDVYFVRQLNNLISSKKLFHGDEGTVIAPVFSNFYK